MGEIQTIGVLFLYTAAAVWDRKTMEIPDTIWVMLLFWGLVCGWVNNRSPWLALGSFFLMLIFLVFICLLMEKILEHRGSEGELLGGGDIKLLSATAFTLGFVETLEILLFSQLLLLLHLIPRTMGRKGKKVVPFAPYLWAGYAIYAYLKKG